MIFFSRLNRYKRVISLLYFAMAVLLYRLEVFDLLLLWILTFSFVFLISRQALLGFFTSLISAAIYFGLYAYYAVPPVDQDRFNGYISTLKAGAHRGLALDAPENTMAAFRLTKELKADALEFDLEFTSDGMAVILHDDTLERTTDGTGRIDQTTWEQAQKLNAAAKFIGGVRKFENEKIPTLEETLQFGLQNGLKMFIDVKTAHKLVRNFFTLTLDRCQFYKLRLFFFLGGTNDHSIIPQISGIIQHDVRLFVLPSSTLFSKLVLI